MFIGVLYSEVWLYIENKCIANIQPEAHLQEAKSLRKKFGTNQWTDRPTDQPTNRPMDRPTDKASYRSALGRIKKQDKHIANIHPKLNL